MLVNRITSNGNGHSLEENLITKGLSLFHTKHESNLSLSSGEMYINTTVTFQENSYCLFMEVEDGAGGPLVNGEKFTTKESVKSKILRVLSSKGNWSKENRLERSDIIEDSLFDSEESSGNLPSSLYLVRVGDELGIFKERDEAKNFIKLISDSEENGWSYDMKGDWILSSDVDSFINLYTSGGCVNQEEDYNSDPAEIKVTHENELGIELILNEL